MSRSEIEVPFVKMQGAGNDYIYIDCLGSVPYNLPELARKVSDRHFGVGSDGLVAILPSKIADFRMRMFNADGSEAEMCGNASRCIGKYVFERGLTDKTEVSLETLAGVRRLMLHVDADAETESGRMSCGEEKPCNGRRVTSVTVDMGVPELRPERIPAVSAGNGRMISEHVDVGGREYEITAVSMGNPHAVIFTEEITDAQVLGEGPVLEHASIFPCGANIEFVRVVSDKELDMRVWERGTGETLACGTGACAAAVAAALNGFAGREADVHLRGGTLHICQDEPTGHVLMTGPAEFVAEGIFHFKQSSPDTDENKR